MQIKPLTHPSEVSGKIELRADGPTKIRSDENRSLPSPKSQSTKAERLNELKSALAEHDITLNYSHDATTNRVVIKLVNDRTGEAIRQMPTEVSLKLAAQIQGLFLDQKV